MLKRFVSLPVFRAMCSARLSIGRCVLFLLLFRGMTGTADTFYIAPVASGNQLGTDPNNPANINAVNWFIQNDTNGDEEVILRFAPGEYVLTQGVSRYAHQTTGLFTNKRIALIGLNPCRSDAPTTFKWADNIHTDPGQDDGWKEAHMVSLSGDNFDRLVIENIVFDGNFDKQTQVVGPHFREGYKSLAVVAAAKSGRIRNCMIRNFGAQGFMPGSLGVPSGIESFQLLITATDPVPAATGATWPETGGYPDSHNWIIEDNEVCNLHFAYGGYCTAIVLNAVGNAPWVTTSGQNLPLPAIPPVRIGVVRRNTLRGRFGDRMPIALGAAHTSAADPWVGRVTFMDNVILNADAGFNMDTGVLRELDFLHNMFLDVGMIGNCGVPADPSPRQSHHTVQDNCVRLRGRPSQNTTTTTRLFPSPRCRTRPLICGGR